MNSLIILPLYSRRRDSCDEVLLGEYEQNDYRDRRYGRARELDRDIRSTPSLEETQGRRYELMVYRADEEIWIKEVKISRKTDAAIAKSKLFY